MRVLLAGASGAIGGPLVQQLRGAGHEVTAIHRSTRGREPLLGAGATPIQVDVLDRAALLDALDGHRCDAVIAQLTAMKKAPTAHQDMHGPTGCASRAPRTCSWRPNGSAPPGS